MREKTFVYEKECTRKFRVKNALRPKTDEIMDTSEKI